VATCIGILGIWVQVSDPALLSEKIRAALEPRRLGEWPTPLEPAPALAGALGVAALGLKREDRAAAPGGGNKVRGLEFLLAGVPPGTVFVTAGGTGSTHCLCTAVHAAALGHQTVLAQFRQPDTVASRAAAGVALAMAALGWPTRVVAVRVAPRFVANRWRTMWLAHAARRLLARHGIHIPHPASCIPLVLVDGLGPGYGYPSAEGEAARR